MKKLTIKQLRENREPRYITLATDHEIALDKCLNANVRFEIEYQPKKDRWVLKSMIGDHVVATASDKIFNSKVVNSVVLDTANTL